MEMNSFSTETDSACEAKKVKTKPANSYGQFLKLRGEELKRADSNAKVNTSVALLEWRLMGPDQKQFYKECYKKEKEKLDGELVRKEVKNKLREVKVKKEKKNALTKSKIKPKKNITVEFLAGLDVIDGKIHEIRTENRGLYHNLLNLREDQAVNRFKMKQVTEELEALKNKYVTLVAQHDVCKS